MRKIYALFCLFFLAITIMPTAQAKSVFSDIRTSPYKTSIEYLAEKGIVAGFPDGTFKPNDSVSRAEMMKIVIGATVAETEYEGKNNCFTDVRIAWFSPYVCYAKEKNIITGYPDGKFRGGNKVKMSEGLKMGIETFGFTTETPLRNALWYKPYIDFAHRNNIFSKYAYLPGREMTRAEMAYVVHQFLLVKEGKRTMPEKRDSRSAGCGKTPPSTPPTSSLVQNVPRDYITVIPPRYDKNKPMKLIFAFHGRTNLNTMVRTYYGVEEASREEAIVVYPAGIRRSGGFSWSNPGDPPDRLRDYAFFDQLLKEFSENYCVDLDHVYVVAHSLGAWFANSLACARGDVIRGIGTLGGGTSIQNNCAGPVAAMIWHNPKDALVGFNQGVMARDQLKRQNACSDQTVPVEPRSANCVAYTGCGIYSPLVWCPHTFNYASWDNSYYTHNWPDITGQEIWQFFKDLGTD